VATKLYVERVSNKLSLIKGDQSRRRDEFVDQLSELFGKRVTHKRISESSADSASSRNPETRIYPLDVWFTSPSNFLYPWLSIFKR